MSRNSSSVFNKITSTHSASHVFFLQRSRCSVVISYIILCSACSRVTPQSLSFSGTARSISLLVQFYDGFIALFMEEVLLLVDLLHYGVPTYGILCSHNIPADSQFCIACTLMLPLRASTSSCTVYSTNEWATYFSLRYKHVYSPCSVKYGFLL